MLIGKNGEEAQMAVNFVYDVVVIGGGPGGYVAAARASQLGLTTALIEKEVLGGTCVNWGCIPTKALLRSAEMVHFLAGGKAYGLEFEQQGTNYSVAHNRSRQIAKRQGKRVEALLKSRGVTVYVGEAHLVDMNTVAIKNSGECLSAKHIILATGTQPRMLPGLDLDGDRVLCAKDALKLTQAPASVLVVGAGPIGLEFATVWQRFGADVTVVELFNRVLPTEDEEISREAEKQFKKAGIKVVTGAKVTHMEKTATAVTVTVATGEETAQFTVEKVLVAAGFVPDTGFLGLDSVGVRTEREYIVTDEQMRSNVPNIFAIGDVTGKLGLAHVASAQGIIAAEAIAGHQTHALVYENIPRCVFGCVEVASAGLTERQAKERGYQAISVISPFIPNGKAVALGENVGFVKLVADEATRRLLGAHIIGPNATELIAAPTTVLALGGTIEQMAKIVYAHPTLSEAISEGFHALTGHAVHL